MGKLLLGLILLSGLIMAKPTVSPVNYNQATINFLGRYLPLTPGFAPRLDIFTYDEDVLVVGYKVTILTPTATITRVIEAIMIDGKMYGYVSIPGEFAGPVTVKVESLYGSGLAESVPLQL